LNEEILDAIERFFAREVVARPAAESTLPATALLLLLARADHEAKPDEHRVLEQVLQRRHGLSVDETAVLVRRAEQAIADGARLPELVESVRLGLTPDQRGEVVRHLWRVAYADAELQPHEEYLVRKVAGLLGLGTADLIEQKLPAREEFLRDDI
jgi:uncharacterized tellurite resistance protein B-like protein